MGNPAHIINSDLPNFSANMVIMLNPIEAFGLPYLLWRAGQGGVWQILDLRGPDPVHPTSKALQKRYGQKQGRSSHADRRHVHPGQEEAQGWAVQPLDAGAPSCCEKDRAQWREG